MRKSEEMIPLFFFLFGIVIGSFLNVCITRIPAGLSIVSPASRCPRCETPIKAYDNVPVLGWIILRGKCRNCGLPISPMYPVIEFLAGALFVLTYYEFGVTVVTFKWLIFGCLIIVLIVTDLLYRILPDAVNWFGFGLGLAFATKIFPSSFARYAPPLFQLPGIPPMLSGVVDALIGSAAGSLLLWAAAALYKAVRHRDGMGMGDVKMMAMVGAFLGARGAFLVILIGTLLGSVVGIATVLILYSFGWRKGLAVRAERRGLGSANKLRWTLASQYQFPLGTFLGVAALFVVYGFPYFLSRFFLYRGL